jgi:hypothetical protein
MGRAGMRTKPKRHRFRDRADAAPGPAVNVSLGDVSQNARQINRKFIQPYFAVPETT